MGSEMCIRDSLLLWRAGMPFELREQVCRIISVHQLPFFALSGNRNGQSPEFILHKLSWELPVWMLCAVAEADMQGRTYVGKQAVLDEIELFRELADEEGCLYGPRAFVDDYTRIQYFRGARVHPDYPLHEPEGSHVVMLSGMPASGKNTWVAKRHPDLPVISFDDAREALGLRHGENEGAAAHFAIDRAKSAARETALRLELHAPVGADAQKDPRPAVRLPGQGADPVSGDAREGNLPA